MTMIRNMLAGGAGLAAIAMAAPASAQYGFGYGYNSTQLAAQRCSAAVQNRLSNRVGIQGIFGSVLGSNVASGRVLSVTQVNPRRSIVRVRGLATSGRSYGYGPYGAGAYGALGYNYQPDLSFRCEVDYRGYVRDVDIMRR